MTDTPSYEIAPEDAKLAAELFNFDPIYGTPSSVEVIGDVRLPTTLSADALPPHMRDPIRAAMLREPVESRPAIERRMVQAALETNTLETKVKAGLGANATEIEREAFAIQGEIHTLNTERYRLEMELAEVSHWTATVDPDTGLPVPQAVEKMTGDRRKGWQERIRLIDHRVDLLNGAEGKFRRDRALFNSVEAHKRKQAQLADHAEVQKRAADMVREERIKTAADSRFRMMRTVV